MKSQNGEIKIEKGIPIPKTPSKYPWDKLEVGDSFIGPRQLQFSLSKYRKATGFTLVSRKQGEDNIRVWRTA